jgi:hypothetical protein
MLEISKREIIIKFNNFKTFKISLKDPKQKY